MTRQRTPTLLIIGATFLALATAQYIVELPDNSAEYIELIRVPRALHHRPGGPPSLVPSSPLPPRVGAPGGIPLPPPVGPHRGVAPPPYGGYEPMVASGSKKEPLVTAESHGHGHHHGHDYVDYGAYTGGWGAFGWYSDHPVHSYGH